MISYPTGTRLILPDGTRLEEGLSQRIIECLERLWILGRLDSVKPDHLEELSIEDAALLMTLKFFVSLHGEIFSFDFQRPSTGRRAADDVPVEAINFKPHGTKEDMLKMVQENIQKMSPEDKAIARATLLRKVSKRC
jgi:hypothetical protein